ncbi:MAG: hypothetical protein HUU18_12215 [Phycisphaerales bacterium]|nr:hypothetical protein [Phycisphaerales bacterium]
MRTSRHNRGLRGLGARLWRAKRRGVAAVLAMMFLVLFGSLSAAMAIASRGNITTAATHLHMTRAQGAAETGLRVASARLAEASARFIVSNSSVDATMGWGLWRGELSAVGQYQILPPRTGRQDLSNPAGLADALAQAHALDQDVVAGAGVSVPTLGNAQAGASTSEYMQTNWLFTPVVAIEARHAGETNPPLAYSIAYAPLANGIDIRVIATGYDFGYTRNGAPVTRTITQDFRLIKSVKHAIISPTRVMVGKNVMVSGDLGCRFTNVNFNNADPLVTRSDFSGLSATLDQKLADFLARMQTYDVDGDNRLRVGHPVEGAGMPIDRDYDGDGQLDGAFADVTGDGYVDEFDIFIKHFDRNGDGRLVLSNALTAGTPAQGQTPEFQVDEDLALLIDSNNPDRNRNGIWGFTDTNGNGRWDSGENMLDLDHEHGVFRDQILGYRDGYIDRRDQYAKIAGRLSFRVQKSAWETAQGPVPARVRGPIVPAAGTSPVAFNVGNDVLPDVNPSVFVSTQTGLAAAADGQTFAQQVASQLGVSVGALATYVESRPPGSTQPRYLRVDPDNNFDGLPDNWTTAYWEKMPYNSPSYSDVYFRPVYENMTFRDVVIPMGTNALFRNCSFIGVTRVQTDTANTHLLWGEYGKLRLDSSGRPTPAVARFVYGDNPGETFYPTMLPATAIPPARMILMATTPLDKADIPSNQVAITQGYNLLPDPLIAAGLRIVDTKTRSNNIRFHDCLIVGSIVSDAPQGYVQVRNKLQFTGATRFATRHPTEPDNASLNPEPADVAQIAKSSLMAPHYSVDLGSFNSPPEQSLDLRGAIIAGVLDARGNTSINGALLLTFAPTYGQAPLVDARGNPVGNPAGFNTTLGYFGPNDGDSESLDPATLPVVGGVRIVGWDTNADGLADVSASQPQPAGSTPVPFHGYGRIQLRYDPLMVLPDGVMLPMGVRPLPATYREGSL